MPSSTPNHSRDRAPSGKVWLIGAGPGAADLLTLRAARLIAQADIIIYDRLVGADIVDLFPKSATCLYVGKVRSHHSVPQAEIHQLLIHHARQGRNVVRLKGGDPLIFGRGGEEIEACRKASIDIEVVPGISAALGAAAAYQIPLTHRDLAQGLSLITGHNRDGDLPELDWAALSQPGHTLVVYMGTITAGHIVDNLLAKGRSPATPVAIVEKVSLPGGQARLMRLDQLTSELIRNPALSPALLVIGEVAALGQIERIKEAMNVCLDR